MPREKEVPLLSPPCCDRWPKGREHLGQQVSSWTELRGATRCTSSPFRTPQRGRALGTTRRNRDLFSTFKWYREPFEAKWGGYFFVVSFILFYFFFSQGFPKWMAVKDFNILQAQQLILKSLAEGFYRGKLGCKSFWRLFPFWNL